MAQAVASNASGDDVGTDLGDGAFDTWDDGIQRPYGNEGPMEQLDHWLGQFPHVVHRLEFGIQMSDIRWRDRLIANGIDPEGHE